MEFRKVFDTIDAYGWNTKQTKGLENTALLEG